MGRSAEALVGGGHMNRGEGWPLSQGSSCGGETQAQVRWELVSCGGVLTNTLTHLHNHTPEPHTDLHTRAHTGHTHIHTETLVHLDSHPLTHIARSRVLTHTSAHTLSYEHIHTPALSHIHAPGHTHTRTRTFMPSHDCLTHAHPHTL